MREAALRTLRLSRGADDAAVRAAYRRLAKEYHPDVPGGSGEAFKRISEAAEFLLGDGSAAAARDTCAAETVGPAIRARWNIRRRHQPSEYPAWFKPSTPELNSAGCTHLFHGRSCRSFHEIYCQGSSGLVRRSVSARPGAHAPLVKDRTAQARKMGVASP